MDIEQAMRPREFVAWKDDYTKLWFKVEFYGIDAIWINGRQPNEV